MQLFRLSESHINAIEQSVLARWRDEFCEAIRIQFPATSVELDELELKRFVSESMNAGRSMYVDERDQLLRWVRITYIVEFEHRGNRCEYERILKVMFTEQPCRARLDFVEKHVIS